MCNGARNNLTDYVKKCVRIWDKKCQDFSQVYPTFYFLLFCVVKWERFNESVQTLLIKEIAIMHLKLKLG